MAQGALSIEAVTAPEDEHVQALSALLPQLSSATPPDLATLCDIAGHPGTTLLIARVEGEIVGTLTLETFRIPTGVRAWIEDVVVDERARGLGVATELVDRALEIAATAGALTVDLTSRPSRVAANALYRRIGFVERATNVYRYTLEI